MKLLRLLTLLVAACLSIAAARAAEADAKAAKAAAPKPDKDGWYQLFNGKDLAGWKLTEDNPDTFKVEDGLLVVKGERCHAFYDGPVKDHVFKNFEWKCEIMTKPKANSGMYFHSKYQADGWPAVGIEVQVNNTHPDPRKTASLYRIKDVMDHSPAKDNEWFTQHVIVEGNHIEVKVNDKVVNEYTQPENFEREEGWEKNVISPEGGTFVIQGHDPESEIHYRKIMVKPLP